MLSLDVLEAEAGSVLPVRDTMSRFVFLNAFVYAPSTAIIVLNRTNNSNAVAIAGASISITQSAS